MVSCLMIYVSIRIIGTLAYPTNKNLDTKFKFKNYLAIFTTGLFLSYLMFEVGRYYNSLAITGVGSAIVSYFSIDVLFVIGAILRVIPKII